MNLFMLLIWFMFAELAIFWMLSLVFWLVSDLLGIDDVSFTRAAGASLAIILFQIALVAAAVAIGRVYPWFTSDSRTALVLGSLALVFVIAPWFFIRQVFHAPDTKTLLLWAAGLGGIVGTTSLLAVLVHNRVVETAPIITHAMTPTLLSRHVPTVCPNCGHTFPVALVLPETAPDPPASPVKKNGSQAELPSRHLGSLVHLVSRDAAENVGPAQEKEQVKQAPPAATEPAPSKTDPNSIDLSPPEQPKPVEESRPTSERAVKPEPPGKPTPPAKEVSPPAAATPQPDAASHTVHCTNCGHTFSLPVSGTLAEQDQVLIDKGAKPTAWQIAALRDPLSPQRVIALRVVGTPGDLIQVAGGDLFRNQNRVVKGLNELSELWLPVHDTAEVAKHAVPKGPGWKPFEGAAWTSKNGVWECDSRNNPKRSQLIFSQRITDDAAWNLREQLPSEIEPLGCRDIRITCEMENVSGVGNFGFVWSYGPGQGEAFKPDVTCGAMVSLAGGKFRLAVTSPPLTGVEKERRELSGNLLQPSASFSTITFAIRDGLIFIAEGNQQLAKIPVEPIDVGVASTRTASADQYNQLILFAQECHIRLHRVKVERDIYYRTLQELDSRLTDAAGRNPMKLSKAEYMVLGDNSLRSKDSRNFGPVNEKMILGPVRYRFWPRERWTPF